MSVIFGPGIGQPPPQGSLVNDTNAADKSPVVVQATDTQTGNLLEFRSPSGALLSAIDVNGAIGGGAGLTGAVILAPNIVGRNTIQPTVDTAEGIVIKGHSPTQSASLLGVKNSAGVSLCDINPVGTTTLTGTDIGASTLQVQAPVGAGAFLAEFTGDNGQPLVQVAGRGLSDTMIVSTQAVGDRALMVQGFTGQTADLLRVLADATDGVSVFRVTAGKHMIVKNQAGNNVLDVDGANTRIGVFNVAAAAQQPTASTAGIAGIRTDTLANAVADIQVILTALRAWGVAFGWNANTA